MCYYDTYEAALTYCNKWVLNNKNKVKWFFMILGTIATLYKYIISRCFIIRGYKMYTLHGHSVRLEKLRTRTIWQTHNNNCLGTNLELILFKSSCYNKPRRYYYFLFFFCVHLNEDVVTVKKMSVGIFSPFGCHSEYLAQFFTLSFWYFLACFAANTT